jgi:hypothetical protein
LALLWVLHVGAEAYCGEDDPYCYDWKPPTPARSLANYLSISALTLAGMGWLAGETAKSDEFLQQMPLRREFSRACCRASSARRAGVVVLEPSQSGGTAGGGFISAGEHFLTSPTLRNSRNRARAVLYWSWYTISVYKGTVSGLAGAGH